MLLTNTNPNTTATTPLHLIQQYAYYLSRGQCRWSDQSDWLRQIRRKKLSRFLILILLSLIRLVEWWPTRVVGVIRASPWSRGVDTLHLSSVVEIATTRNAKDASDLKLRFRKSWGLFHYFMLHDSLQHWWRGGIKFEATCQGNTPHFRVDA